MCLWPRAQWSFLPWGSRCLLQPIWVSGPVPKHLHEDQCSSLTASRHLLTETSNLTAKVSSLCEGLALGVCVAMLWNWLVFVFKSKAVKLLASVHLHRSYNSHAPLFFHTFPTNMCWPMFINLSSPVSQEFISNTTSSVSRQFNLGHLHERKKAFSQCSIPILLILQWLLPLLALSIWPDSWKRAIVLCLRSEYEAAWPCC